MKKTISFLCLILSFVSLTIFSANARGNASVEDSLFINEDIRSKLQVQDTDEIVLAYSMGLRYAFTKCTSINEVLTSNEVFGIYYAVKSQDGTWTYRVENDKNFEMVEMQFVNHQALDACLSGEIVSRIAPDAQVYNTYYLSGESGHMGTAIYYITDKGEYVHFFGGKDCVGEFLMPAEAFWELQTILKKAASENEAKLPLAAGGADGDWDLSVYDLKSDAFDLNAESPFKERQEDARNERLLWICISAGVCLAASGVLFTVIRKRKTKTE